MAPGNNNDVNIRVKAETKAASRDLREVERQVSKLGDLSNQGKNRQDGFLSPKQVQMYKDVVRQIKAVQDQYIRQLDQVNREVETRQKQYNQAQIRGANTHATFYQTKLKQAQAQQAVAQSAANDVNAQATVANRYSNTIGGMHQLSSSGRNLLYSAGNMIHHTGMVTGVRSGINYIAGGMALTKSLEHNTLAYGTKTGYGSNIPRAVRDLQNAGIPNGYNGAETQQTASMLLSSQGTSGNIGKLNADIQSIQKFSRATGTDADTNAGQFGHMAQMGATSEGDQRRFADLIAGSIVKSKMNGREEEALRSTINLANQVGSTMTKLTDKQAGNIVGLQTSLAQSIPTMAGDRGANLLGGIDSAIKNGGNNMDLLMGKGTEFMGGAKAMNDLQRAKDKGVSDPKNLYRIFSNATKTIPDIEYRKSVISQETGMSLTQVDDMYSSGMVSKILSNNLTDPNDLTKEGSKMIDQKSLDSSKSMPGQENVANAILQQQKGDAGGWLSHLGTKAKSLYTSQPEWDRMAEVGVGSVLGLKGISKASRGLVNGYKWATSAIDGSGGIANMGKNLLKGGWSGGKNLITNPRMWAGMGEGLATGGIGLAGGYMASYLNDNWDQINTGASNAAKTLSTPQNMGYGDYMKHEAGNLWQGLKKAPKNLWSIFTSGKFASDSSINAQGGVGAAPYGPSAPKGFGDILKPIQVEHHMTIKVEGKIDGMNATNQDGIRNDFQKYFGSVYSNIASSSGINLSIDQTRN